MGLHVVIVVSVVQHLLYCKHAVMEPLLGWHVWRTVVCWHGEVVSVPFMEQSSCYVG